MNLDQILADIAAAHPDDDILALVDAMAKGRLNVRKQLADLISREPARLRPLVLLEVSCWGVNDGSSRCREISACGQ